MEKCEICGGKLNITIGSDVAVCDSCGNSATIPAADVRKYRDIYKAAEMLMRLNSVSGFEDAIRKLQTIAFIPQAQGDLSPRAITIIVAAVVAIVVVAIIGKIRS